MNPDPPPPRPSGPWPVRLMTAGDTVSTTWITACEYASNKSASPATGRFTGRGASGCCPVEPSTFCLARSSNELNDRILFLQHRAYNCHAELCDPSQGACHKAATSGRGMRPQFGKNYSPIHRDHRSRLCAKIK